MTSIQRIRISFSCSFFLVSCAAATIGNQRLTYYLAMSAFLHNSQMYCSAYSLLTSANSR